MIRRTYLVCSTLTSVAGAYAQDVNTGEWFGTIRPPLDPPTGQAVDRIQVGDNSTGLAYADQNLLGASTTPTLFYTVRQDATSGVSYLDTIATPVAPHATVPAIADRFALGTANYSALAFAAPDLTYGPTILYSLSQGVGGPGFGTITPAGAVQTQFAVGSQFGSLTFAATDVGYGANLMYYLRQTVGGTEFGTIDPHQPGTITDRSFLNLNNIDGLVFTATDVGYGPDLFYYLRANGAGQEEFGTINPLTGVAVDRFALSGLLDDYDGLTFTTTDVGYGPNLFYYLRSGGAAPVPEMGGPGSLAACAAVFGGWQWRAARRRKAGRKIGSGPVCPE